MKSKTILLVYLTALFSLCACESPTPVPVSESSIADISLSSTVSSEPKVASITLNQHEASVVTDESITVSFKLRNYRGDVLVANSDVNICRARIEKKNLIIDGLNPGTAVLTVIAGDARDELLLTVEKRSLTFLEHSYSKHVRNSVSLSFTSNGSIEDFDYEIIDLDVGNAKIVSYRESYNSIYLIAYDPCNFKVRITSRDAYDIAEFNYYVTSWPDGASLYDGHPLVIRDINNDFPSCCAVLTPFSYGNFFSMRVELGVSTISGGVYQGGVKDGKYYFSEPPFELNLDSAPQKGPFAVVDFDTLNIWADLGVGGGTVPLYGPNFEPYHLTTYIPIEGIVFEEEQTYHKGETVTFVSSPTNDGADYYPYYEIIYQEMEDAEFVEHLDDFNHSLIFNKTGTYKINAKDCLTEKRTTAIITIID